MSKATYAAVAVLLVIGGLCAWVTSGDRDAAQPLHDEPAIGRAASSQVLAASSAVGRNEPANSTHRELAVASTRSAEVAGLRRGQSAIQSEQSPEQARQASLSTSPPDTLANTLAAKPVSTRAEPAQADSEAAKKVPPCENPQAPNGYIYRETKHIFDLTPEEAIWYSTAGGFIATLDTLMANLCGMVPWPDDYPPAIYELVLVRANKSTTLYVGNAWLGDGINLVPISAHDFESLDGRFKKRRLGPGPNMSRSEFEQFLIRRRGPG
mgnify:CR=1 FL=1